ncbi:hypothetical protein KMC49_gp05 [Ralstonia phage Firinga]|uniref:Replication protein n=2 Tax=Firingavirus firinga TaxID=2846043 RepID=A0A7G5B9V0_9CAUD|nr:hypothetical protein KMC49_gp05 [Ralstonia phage Firinga]QMV33073.1 hypothetical protein 18C_00005 [Ralstonia phage Firinga]QMV33333.1 hypothetical protein 12C_00023 [Ralstonia phage Hennie]
MDWFRWWHGTVTDPKFQWVARKSGQPVGSVIAVWAALLECASTATQGNADATRGNVASFDCNDYDVALGFGDGIVQSIFSAMEQKGLIVDRCISKWNERQPKREDSGNPNTGALSSTERSRLRRERLKQDETQCNARQRNATLGNDREEKSREEDKEKDIGASAPSAGADLLCPVTRIVGAYHELMPCNPRVKVLNEKRRRSISARWREAAKLDCKPFGYSSVQQGVEAWSAFFKVCAESDFLTGKAKPSAGKPPFFADIDFLMSPEGFAKCLENKYHREAT